MYITVNDKNYDCQNFRSYSESDTITFFGVNNLELPLEGTIKLFTKLPVEVEGSNIFELNSIDVSSYERVIYVDDVLTLTNVAESEPSEEPPTFPTEPAIDLFGFIHGMYEVLS